MKRVLIALAFLLVVVTGFWQIVVTEEMLSDLMKKATQNSDLKLDIAELHKGFFYWFRCDSLTLSKGDTPLLKVGSLRCSINPFSLLMLKLTADFEGMTGNGKISGNIGLMKRNTLVNISLVNSDTEALPFFSLLGLDGRGKMSGEFSMKNSAGELKLTLDEMNFRSASFGGTSVPVNMFSHAKGALSIEAGVLRVTSFSLEGNGIYARLKGKITGNDIDMTMELMPDKTFSEKNPLLMMLGQYKVSPGYYEIPIKSRLPI